MNYESYSPMPLMVPRMPLSWLSPSETEHYGYRVWGSGAGFPRWKIRKDASMMRDGFEACPCPYTLYARGLDWAAGAWSRSSSHESVAAALAYAEREEASEFSASQPNSRA